MLIYSEHITPRLKYVVRFIFKDFLGINAELTSNRNDFIKSNDHKISYWPMKIGEEFNIHPAGLLFENRIRNIRPAVTVWKDMPVIFSTGDHSDLPFDLFSAVFFMISRYEEYLSFLPDRYGRFPADQSLAGSHGFLEQAVVDRWILSFCSLLQRTYPDLRFPERHFRFIPTVDVDLPYAYLHKGTFRCMGGALKSILKLDFSRLKERLDVMTGKQQDPFYTFNLIKEIHDDPGLITFFLTAGYGRYDKGIDPDSGAFKELVQYVSSFSTVGLHPSWKSNKKTTLLEKELHTLSCITEERITRSRQHFLKINLPETYNKLSALGIAEDYSMGYASHTGFRTGTSVPFLFYDLLNERETFLKIFPFQVMDVTLKDYLCLSPPEASNKINELVGEVRDVKGTLISIWHNDAFSDAGEWEGWPEVYRKLLKIVKSEKR